MSDALKQMRRRVAEGNVQGPSDPLQHSRLLHVPGLSAKPWHEPAAFPHAAEMEAATDEIRGEFLALEALEPAGALNYTSGAEGWLLRVLHEEGQWNEAVIARAPFTTGLIRRWRLTLGDFLFAELAPGGYIDLHSGGCNAVLSVHLPLIVPDGDCGIAVANQLRRWREGKLLAFDDSYLHRVWNNTAERRVVLVWEVFHPELSDAEAEAVKTLFQERMDAADAAARA